VNLDLSFYKAWKATERLSIQFRFDAFAFEDIPSSRPALSMAVWHNGLQLTERSFPP
jgi:hypothetical protein